MKRKVLALGCGVAGGFLLGSWLHLGNVILSLENPASMLLPALLFLVVGSWVGSITSLVSWKHTPGLPGMAFALTWVVLGTMTKPIRAASDDLDLQSTLISLMILLSLLFAYLAAWLADTYVVFRALPVRPPAKQIGWKRMATQLLPCCFLTGLGAMLPILWLPLPVLASVLVGFFVSAFAASTLFRTPSTLWYALAGPLGFVGLGMAALWKPTFSIIGNIPMAALCGCASAAAIAGHWLWAGLKKLS